MELTELIVNAPCREIITYRDTWPHEKVFSGKDGQQDLLEAVVALFSAGEGGGLPVFPDGKHPPLCRRPQVLVDDS